MRNELSPLSSFGLCGPSLQGVQKTLHTSNSYCSMSSRPSRDTLAGPPVGSLKYPSSLQGFSPAAALFSRSPQHDQASSATPHPPNIIPPPASHSSAVALSIVPVITDIYASLLRKSLRRSRGGARRRRRQWGSIDDGGFTLPAGNACIPRWKPSRPAVSEMGRQRPSPRCGTRCPSKWSVYD